MDYVSIMIIIIGVIYLTSMVFSDGFKIFKHWEFYLWIFCIPMNIYILFIKYG